MAARHPIPTVLLPAVAATAAAVLGSPPIEAVEPEAAAEARIVVGPDVLASRDGDFPHVEPMVAASPRDPDTLVAGAIVFPRPDRDSGCRVYSSRDGGSTWTEADPAARPGSGADPQVAFTAQGTALFVCLVDVAGEDERSRFGLHVFRSEDGGSTWDAPVELGAHSYDHPQIAVDSTTGRHAGNVYIGVLYVHEREYRIGVFRSDDDGRSFVGPVEVARGGSYGEGQGLNVTGLGVLSDGALVVGSMDFPLAPGPEGPRPREAGSWIALSEDGGVTFSEPRRAATRVHDPPDRDLGRRLGGFPVWAVDGSGSATRDRLYHSWTDWRSGSARVLVSASGDRGRTWSEPAAVEPDAPAGVHQFLPALAVNAEGTLGVSYSDTRGFPEGDGYHRRFTASVDGGASFLRSRLLSSAPSRPQEASVNRRPVFQTLDDGSGALSIAFVSAVGRWPGGGDYMGLAADARGTFHALWSDARDGAFQLWASQVRVEHGPETPGEGEGSGAPPEGAPDPSSTEQRSVTGRIELVSDPASWDPEAREIRVPVRLRNTSDEPIYPPIEVVVVGLEWEDPPEELQEFWSERSGRLLNADNDATGAGARFDYTPTLRDLQVLEPGAVTGARVWRIHQPKEAMPPIRIEVRGTVERR